MLNNIKTHFFIGFSTTKLYNNNVGKQINHNAYKQTYPTIPTLHNAWYVICPLTNESPWGGISCLYITIHHNTIPHWEWTINGKSSHINRLVSNHNASIIPMGHKNPPHWEQTTHCGMSLYGQMKICGEDNYVPKNDTSQNNTINLK